MVQGTTLHASGTSNPQVEEISTNPTGLRLLDLQNGQPVPIVCLVVVTEDPLTHHWISERARSRAEYRGFPAADLQQSYRTSINSAEEIQQVYPFAKDTRQINSYGS